MQFDFGNVLTRAGQIIWRFKVLWIFGILASCGRPGSSGGGGGSSGGSGGGGGGGYFLDSGYPKFGVDLPEFLRFPQDVPEEGMFLIILGVIFLALILSLTLAVVLFFVRTLGRLGLIQGTLFAEAGAERLGFMQLVNASKPYFWRVFLLNLLIGVAAIALAIVFGGPFALFMVLTYGIGFICLFPLFILAIPIALFVRAFIEQSNVAVVVDDLDVFAALQKGWDVVRDNWGPALVISLVTFLARLTIGAIIAIPLIFTFLPLALGIVGGSISENMNLIFGGVGVFLLCICALTPFLLVIGGMVEAYVGSVWTLTYARLTGHEPSLPELEAGTA